MRGEHFNAQVIGEYNVGSPPHARGAQFCKEGYVILSRITPACAGSTLMLEAPPGDI